MSTKIRIKVGTIEVEYEGSEAFLKEELPGLLSIVSKVAAETGHVIPDADRDRRIDDLPGKIQGTTATIAAKLNVSSGPDLILAACAHLTLVKKQDTFSRKQIIEAMKTATGYFKQSYVGNLTAYLKNLTKDGKLVEPSTDQFVLTPTTRADLEKQLAQ